MFCISTRFAFVFVVSLSLSGVGYAQDPAPDSAQQSVDEDDAMLKLAEPGFTLIGLPTSLRVPFMKSAFRVTHRFARPLGEGDFGDLADDLFGLDSGAQIGLEYRYGLFSGTQIGLHRTSTRTIEFFGQHQVIRQGDASPLTIDALATIDGPLANDLVTFTYDEWGRIKSRTIGGAVASVMYDQLGSGRSDRPKDKSLWTIERFVGELQRVRDALKLDRVHILGHSWGSMLAVDYMLTRPKGVESLILAGPALSIPRFLKDAQALRAELPEEVQANTLEH